MAKGKGLTPYQGDGAVTDTFGATVESDGKVVTHGRTPTRNARIARHRSIHTNRNSLRRAKTPISTRQSIILSIFAGDANSLGITVEMMLTIDREGGLRKM